MSKFTVGEKVRLLAGELPAGSVIVNPPLPEPRPKATAALAKSFQGKLGKVTYTKHRNYCSVTFGRTDCIVYDKWLEPLVPHPVKVQKGPSYKAHDPKGWGGDPRRGAAMGRHDYKGTLVGKVTLQHIRLDSGGYDPNGTYFGIGAPLYWAASDDGAVDYVFRARNRADAKEEVLIDYPGAKFKV